MVVQSGILSSVEQIDQRWAAMAYGMDQIDPGKHGFDFVALKMPHHMPLRPGLGTGVNIARTTTEPFVDGGRTFGQLLNMVFAQVGNTHIDQSADDVEAGELGYGHHRNAGGVSSGAVTGFVNATLDAFPILSEFALHRQ